MSDRTHLEGASPDTHPPRGRRAQGPPLTGCSLRRVGGAAVPVVDAEELLRCYPRVANELPPRADHDDVQRCDDVLTVVGSSGFPTSYCRVDTSAFDGGGASHRITAAPH